MVRTRTPHRWNLLFFDFVSKNEIECCEVDLTCLLSVFVLQHRTCFTFSIGLIELIDLIEFWDASANESYLFYARQALSRLHVQLRLEFLISSFSQLRIEFVESRPVERWFVEWPSVERRLVEWFLVKRGLIEPRLVERDLFGTILYLNYTKQACIRFWWLDATLPTQLVDHSAVFSIAVWILRIWMAICFKVQAEMDWPRKPTNFRLVKFAAFNWAHG